MFRILALSMLLLCSACTDGGPAQRQGSTASQQAPESGGAGPAGAPPPQVEGAPPDQEMVNCLNRFREKKYDEALTACRRALASNPGDPQILKAIELSEQALKENGA